MEKIRELMNLKLASLSGLLSGNFNGIGLADDDLVKAQVLIHELSCIIGDAELVVVNEVKILEISHHLYGVKTRESRRDSSFQQFLSCLRPGA